MDLLIIGLCAVLASYLGARHANYLNNKTIAGNEINFEKIIVQSIRSELKTIYDLYGESFIEHLAKLKDDQLYTYTWSARHDYFSIYHSNGMFIGRIKDEEVRNSIINTYMHMKSFLEQLLDYSKEYEKYMFEKNQLLKLLNLNLNYPIKMNDLDIILHPEVKIEDAFVKMSILYDKQSVLDTNKFKSQIFEQRQHLMYYTSGLKSKFNVVSEKINECLNLIEIYLETL